jgi:tRNA(fMet)-specific endonuclease VapC
MKLLDTDIFTLLNAGNARVRQRAEKEKELMAIAIVTRIEVLLGRFQFVLKASNGDDLQRAQRYLVQSERDLAKHRTAEIDPGVAAEFDRLRENKKLKTIGRRDLLIACIALANRATLVTRNLKHFRLVPGLALENWAD